MFKSVSACCLAVLFLATSVSPLAAQEAMTGFVPIDRFVFSYDGVKDPDAEILQSQTARAFLILSNRIESPLLIQLAKKDVSTVHLLKVDRQAGGGANLLAGATLASLGDFEVGANGVTFGAYGKTAALENKPDLLGNRSVAEMFNYSKEYRKGADAYTSSKPVIDQLRDQGRGVEVKVFFGSWCPHCQQVLPRVLKVAEGLEGSKVAMTFHGLPNPQTGGSWKGTEADRLDIESVPTGVIYVDGEEVARISGSGWKIPELAIKNAL